MKKIKVSVIVPVYNVEIYLRRCIESIINQTLQEIEIILVNDGSTDNSKKICEEFVSKDNRIKLINQKNGGQGAARNSGLKIAKGQYIGFVDSDDYIDIQMYEKLYKEIIKENACIAVCQVNRVNENNVITPTCLNKSRDSLIETGKESMIRYLKFGRWSACDKLYKKDLFKNAKFAEGRTCGEDHVIIVPVLKNVKKIVTVEEYFYNYLVRGGSTTNNQFNIKNFDIAYIWESVLNQVEFEDKEIKAIVDARLFSSYIDLINGAIQDDIKLYTHEIKKFKSVLKKNRLKTYMNKNIMNRYKAGIFLINVNFELYKKIYKRTRSLKQLI